MNIQSLILQSAVARTLQFGQIQVAQIDVFGAVYGSPESAKCLISEYHGKH